MTPPETSLTRPARVYFGRRTRAGGSGWFGIDALAGPNPPSPAEDPGQLLSVPNAVTFAGLAYESFLRAGLRVHPDTLACDLYEGA